MGTERLDGPVHFRQTVEATERRDQLGIGAAAAAGGETSGRAEPRTVENDHK